MLGGSSALSWNSIRTAFVVVACAASAGGCAQVGGLAALNPHGETADDAASPGRPEAERLAGTSANAPTANPRDVTAVLAQARNLKAVGDKAGALAVLQQASQYHGGHRELASEYGRLALEFDQLDLADKLLAMADDPARPDWRVVSARGTVRARREDFKGAVALFERAETLSPGNPVVANNLAMALAATGEAKRAETILQRAIAIRPEDAKIRRNLALVASLQGKNAPATPPSAPQVSSRPHDVPVAPAPAPQQAPKLAAVPPRTQPTSPQVATPVAATPVAATPAWPGAVIVPSKPPAVAGWMQTTVTMHPLDAKDTQKAAAKPATPKPAPADQPATEAARPGTFVLPRDTPPSGSSWPAGRTSFD
jgi:Flp pilus assembly protein TadD